jgi:flagellar biosynthesis/type III secretory pathway M-ring protein FliF/YscJ
VITGVAGGLLVVVVAILFLLLYMRRQKQTEEEVDQHEFETVPELSEMSDDSESGDDQTNDPMGDNEVSFLSTFGFEGTEEAVFGY